MTFSQTLSLAPDDVVVAVTTRHLFGLGRVRASVRLVQGSVRLDDDGALLRVEAQLDAASFDSGSRSRDRAVLSSRMLDVGHHSLLSFVSSSTTRQGEGSWRVQGTVTARGVSAPTTLLVHRSAVDGAVSATARVDRYAHGVTAGRGLASRFLELAITVSTPAVARP